MNGKIFRFKLYLFFDSFSINHQISKFRKARPVGADLFRVDKHGELQAGRERDRQAGRQAGRERERERQTGRQTDRQTDRQAGRERERQTGRQAGRQRERDRQADRQTDRQTDRVTDGQRDMTKLNVSFRNYATHLKALISINVIDLIK